MIHSGNPALRADTFIGVRSYNTTNIMTISGTVNKTFLLLFITVLTATWVWSNIVRLLPFVWPAAIGGLIIGFITVFKKQWAAITSPIYAALEGMVLGGISAIFEQAYPGIVIQAVGLTFGVLFCLLMAYKSQLIKPTENFKLGVVAATGGIALVYFISIVMGFFGLHIHFIHESGPVGIGFSIFVVIIAALNLVLDFDFIENGTKMGTPKYMEWYAAFGLIVTLIWLYLEILRLLAKTRRR
jgi:uncharacterized YccA/Bax inhibitor family protein